MANYSKTLDHAFKHGLNVLLRGKHGIGKTALVKECLDNQGLVLNQNWLYFSAATMDPWVDFVGVPKEKVDANGCSYLELVRPQALQNDQIQVIFFDELNRSHKKIRNAVMELIQFGSINGRKFKNLKCIWAAINPDDDSEANYDVEKLDPAQIDRFHIQIDIPYKPDPNYFQRMYGEKGVYAVKWWMDASREVKDLVSPRRLEYALQVMAISGDIKGVLNSPKINVTELKSFLDKGDPLLVLNGLLDKDDQTIRAFFADHNSFKHVKKDLLSKDRYLNGLAPLIPDEEILKELKPKKRITALAAHVAKNPEKYEQLTDVVVNNSSAYHSRIVIAFSRLRDKRRRERLTASTTSSSNLSPTSRRDLAGLDKHILMLKGQAMDARQLTFCFTGTLKNYVRSKAEAMVKAAGANVALNVTSKVTHVVATNMTSFKAKKALRLKITILDEQEFKDMFHTTSKLPNKTIKITSSAYPSGKVFNVDDLNIHNFYGETGRRFRMTKEQLQKCRDGTLTRPEAFREFLNDLAN